MHHQYHCILLSFLICVLFTFLKSIQSLHYKKPLLFTRLHLSKHSIQMSTTAPEWDAELGIWVGEKAPGTVSAEDFPQPLYIFGYGSLIWRPGVLLEVLPSYPCTAIGYKRVFAQKSCDHRGTAKFPGLVLNLVSRELLSSKGYSTTASSSQSGSEKSSSTFNNEEAITVQSGSLLEDDCHGLIWYIPKDRVVDVIEDLDFREKGGYHRHFIQVTLKEDTHFHKRGQVVDALVYTGHETNPNFFLPESIASNEDDVFALQKRSIVTDIISTAIGPSGTNLEYLFRLQQYLEERGMADDYINNLARAVRMRIGPWRRKVHYSVKREKERKRRLSLGRQNPNNIDDVKELLRMIDGEYEIQFKLFGWGSNEFSQLLYRNIGNDDNQSIEGKPETIEPYAVDIADRVPSYVSSEWTSLREIPSKSRKEKLPWSSLENHHVIAGGSASAYLWDHDKIRIWGKELVNKFIKQHNLSRRDDEDNVSMVLEGIIGAAIGFNHMLLLTNNNKVIAIGDNSHNECNVPSAILYGSYELKCEYSSLLHVYSFQSSESEDLMEGHKVVKLSAGLRHSAAILENGGLLLWGDNSHGQCSESNSIWYPPEGRKVIDICCGAKHTIVVDDHGDVYSVGSNRYGSLGRPIDASDDSSLDQRQRKSNSFIDWKFSKVAFPHNVKIQRVSCGWYHNVARGITPDGHLLFFAWGRNDMSQFIALNNNNNGPVLLAPLPAGRTPAEIWCGSEFTLVVDNEDGFIWGCGWNEHGNLGKGPIKVDDANIVSEWTQVKSKSITENATETPMEVHIWEGSLACGGGHVIAISE